MEDDYPFHDSFFEGVNNVVIVLRSMTARGEFPMTPYFDQTLTAIEESLTRYFSTDEDDEEEIDDRA